MNGQGMRGLTRLGILTLAVAAQAGCVVGGWGSYKTVEEVRTSAAAFDAGDSIEVRTVNGSVTIERDDVTQATVVAELRARDLDRLSRMLVKTDTSEAGTLFVEVEPADGEWLDGEGASFDITLPGADGVDVATANGRIRIRGLGGEALLRTSNGRIDVDDHDGSVDANTSNGRIELAGVTGDIDAVTSNGRIEAHRADGHANLATSNGDVVLELGPSFSGAITAATSNGRVHVNGAFRAGDSMSRAGRNVASLTIGDSTPASSVTTSNGGISIRMPAGND